jgi:hypothetical protein
MELSAWGPLIAMWIGGAIHLGWIVHRDTMRTGRYDDLRRRAA